jgi:hypothetical protein
MWHGKEIRDFKMVTIEFKYIFVKFFRRPRYNVYLIYSYYEFVLDAFWDYTLVTNDYERFVAK